MNLNKTVQKYREIFKAAPVVKTAHTDKGHFYVSPIDPVPYHSVTYFTSFIKDPSLSNWKMNRALEYVDSHFISNDGEHRFWVNAPNAINWFEFLDKAKSAPEGEFHNAGDIGTQVHNWRQWHFQSWINSEMGQLTNEDIDSWPLPENAPLEVISGCRAIKRFLKETGYIPVACELALVDDELKVGGQIDDLGIFPNKYTESFELTNSAGETWQQGAFKTIYKPYLGFVDLKTSNQGKKPAYAYQVRGFYQRMIRKTFKIKPKKTFILHTSKADGTYKLIDLTDMKFLEKDCADLVRLSRSWDGVTEAFKPKVITI